MHTFSRRKFLALSALGLVGARAASAIPPFKRVGNPQFKLGLAAYSFRQFFKEEKGKPVPGGKLDMAAFIDYCADQGAGAELTSYYFPKDPSDEYLLGVRRHAFLRGVEITGTAVGNNFALPNGPERDQEIADVKQWIHRASVLGAPHIRVFAGAAKGVDDAAARKLCISALEECSEFAGSKGIFLGLENHGGIVAKAEGVLEIVQAVESRWLGVNLDTGNFHSADPYSELAQCAPYAVNVQIKTEIKRAGAKEAEPADLPKLAGILREANYQGWVTLEYEAKEDPWTAVPPLLVQLRTALDAPAAPKKEAAWVPIFDGKTLDGWKPTGFSGQGDLTIEDGKLVLAQGGDLTGINYAKEIPKLNYEVALEAMRVEGSDFFCGLTLPYGKEGFTFVVGGWGGSVVGISSINSDDASENETTQYKKFEVGRWYRIRVRVTGEKIEAWLDDEQVANVSTEGKRIAMRAGEIEMSQPFGIATFRTKAALRNLRLRAF